MANFLVGGGNKVSIKVSAIPPTDLDPGRGGQIALVKRAAIEATNGRKVGITVQVKNNANTVISELKGVAIVTNYSEDYPADGILTYNCTFTGYGSPELDGIVGSQPS